MLSISGRPATVDALGVSCDGRSEWGGGVVGRAPSDAVSPVVGSGRGREFDLCSVVDIARAGTEGTGVIAVALGALAGEEAETPADVAAVVALSAAVVGAGVTLMTAGWMTGVESRIEADATTDGVGAGASIVGGRSSDADVCRVSDDPVFRSGWSLKKDKEQVSLAA